MFFVALLMLVSAVVIAGVEPTMQQKIFMANVKDMEKEVKKEDPKFSVTFGISRDYFTVRNVLLILYMLIFILYQVLLEMYNMVSRRSSYAGNAIILFSLITYWVCDFLYPESIDEIMAIYISTVFSGLITLQGLHVLILVVYHHYNRPDEEPDFDDDSSSDES